jgi:hypothetical protein
MSLYGEEGINVGNKVVRESQKVTWKTAQPGEARGSSGTPALTRARRSTLPRDWLLTLMKQIVEEEEVTWELADFR